MLVIDLNALYHKILVCNMYLLVTGDHCLATTHCWVSVVGEDMEVWAAASSQECFTGVPSVVRTSAVSV